MLMWSSISMIFMMIFYFFYYNYALFMCFSLLMSTFLLCFFSFYVLGTSFYSYIMFLIFMGALMVLYIYIIMMISNEKLNMNVVLSLFLFLMGSFMLMMYFMFSVEMMMSGSVVSSFSFFSLENFKILLMNIYSGLNMKMFIFVIFYMLFAMFILVKLIMKFDGCLKVFKFI
uniref:NADH dehydrogenase subunit 6 n=1 Tax=Lophogaster typicus TaxID=419538 RepID=UPI002176C661|nr:NADH dehydrogenase subunit 6 [Lophogaster typicus]UUL70711.1 NADH dehydrogenase subunit 6 [Lophogaster typicus]